MDSAWASLLKPASHCCPGFSSVCDLLIYYLMLCTTTAIGYLIIHCYIWCHAQTHPWQHKYPSFDDTNMQCKKTCQFPGDVMGTDAAAASVCACACKRPSLKPLSLTSFAPCVASPVFKNAQHVHHTLQPGQFVSSRSASVWAGYGSACDWDLRWHHSCSLWSSSLFVKLKLVKKKNSPFQQTAKVFLKKTVYFNHYQDFILE